MVTTITLELEVEVDYNYIKPERGPSDAYGRPVSPDEPGEVEVLSVMLGDCEILAALTKEQLRDLENRCFEDHQDHFDEPYDYSEER